MAKTNVDKLAEKVNEELRKYARATDNEISKAVTFVARECVKELHGTSPEDTGNYKKGWRVRSTWEAAWTHKKRVHNQTDWQLTHLLEYGHAKRNGGRVAAIPHIKEAEQNAIDLMIKKTKEALSK